MQCETINSTEHERRLFGFREFSSVSLVSRSLFFFGYLRVFVWGILAGFWIQAIHLER